MDEKEVKDQEVKEEVSKTSEKEETKQEEQVESAEKSAQAEKEETKQEEQVESAEKSAQAEKEEPKAESNEALATRKFAEGAKKKEKEILSTLGVASIEEAKALINTAKEQGANYKELAAKSICVDLDVKKEFREDVIDIVKGKGLDITEENVKAILAKHPDWVLKADESGSPVVEIGKTGGKGQPEAANEREQAKKLFR